MYLFEVTQASIVKTINIKLKSEYFNSEYLSSYEVKDYSKIISVISNDLKLIETNYLDQIFAILSRVLLFVVSLCYMLYLNFFISLIFVCFSILPIIVPKIMQSKLKETANVFSEKNADYSKVIKEVFNGFYTLRSYSVIKEIITLSNKKLNNLEASAFKLKQSSWTTQLISAIISGFCFIVPFVVGCYFVIYQHNLSFSALIGIFLANDAIIGPIQEIAAALGIMNTTTDLRKKYLKYLKQSDEQSKVTDRYPSTFSTNTVEEININKVQYKLGNGNNLTLNMSLRTPFRVLLIGPSGSGKTTIVNLINGILSPYKGNIIFKSKDKLLCKNKVNISTIDQSPYCSLTIDVRPSSQKRRNLDMIRVPPTHQKGIFS
ncbi:drug efflux ABC transporter, ATP-binding/permease protein [Streptococcus troglodytae]|uniref:Drug efflux ABC transporter, ATP-binding/permease protein n=2 Tax=Streptococcus troglodytae TaxID=1111760 RepID=A0A1L7LM08_9STRE|nr:drug efflux ABC transporter, ATP-binding/permease protein [Streptococcus troglodytae]